jgi:hypothetical protein
MKEDELRELMEMHLERKKLLEELLQHPAWALLFDTLERRMEDAFSAAKGMTTSIMTQEASMEVVQYLQKAAMMEDLQQLPTDLLSEELRELEQIVKQLESLEEEPHDGPEE